MAARDKDPITCHVLDTTIGRPARGVRVRLELASSHPASPHRGGGLPVTFESQTDDDGRVRTWLPYSSETAAGEVPVYTLDDVLGGLGADASRWVLRFDAAGYFGGDDKTFFPEVTVGFAVRPGEHYHVPLLLAPYSYSTYRGS